MPSLADALAMSSDRTERASTAARSRPTLMSEGVEAWPTTATRKRDIRGCRAVLVLKLKFCFQNTTGDSDGPCGCVASKSPGARLHPPFCGDVTFFYTVTAPPRPAPPRSAPPRAAPPCAAPPAPSLRSAACAALPLPRRLRRDASHRAAARGAASPGSASHRAAWPVRPCVSAPRAAL